MATEAWFWLMVCLYAGGVLLPGQDPEEWLTLAGGSAYDEVDRLLVDAETIGGG